MDGSIVVSNYSVDTRVGEEGVTSMNPSTTLN